MMIELILMAMLIQQEPNKYEVTATTQIPDKWVLEYPYVIAGFVDDYYDCLRSGSYEVGGDLSWEDQHRTDIPRCEKLKVEMLQKSKERLNRPDANGSLSKFNADDIFQNVQFLHISRGRDLDLPVPAAVRTDRNEITIFNIVDTKQTSEKPLDADTLECIMDLKLTKQARQDFQDAEDSKIEAIYDKDSYSDQDKGAIASYRLKLSQFNSNVQLLNNSCGSAALKLDNKTQPAADK